MNWLRSVVTLVGMIFMLSAAHAGSEDPIGWNLVGGFPLQTFPNQLYVNTIYTFVNNAPFTLPTPLFIKKVFSTPEFRATDNCSGLKLTPGQTCTVSLAFFPITSGVKTAHLEEQYGRNVVPLPTLATTVTPVARLVVATVTTPLPPTIGTGEPRNVAFQYTNIGNGAVINVAYTPDYPLVGFVENTNTCSSITALGAGQSCTVTGTLTATSAGNYTVAGTLSFTGGTATASTSTVASVQVTGAPNPALPFPTMGTGTTTPVGFTFTNNGSAPIVGILPIVVNAGAGTFTQTSPNCPATVAAGASCTVNGTVVVNTQGPYTVSADFTYAGGTATASTSSVATIQVTGVPDPALPFPTMGTGTITPVGFTFTNNSSGSIVGVLPIVVNAGAGTFTQTNPNCPTTIAAGASCSIFGTVVVNTVGPYTLSADFTYAGGVVSSSSSSTAAILVTGTASTPLPNPTGAGLVTPVAFTFTNTATGPTSAPATIVINDGVGTFTQTANDCTSAPLPAGSSCTVSGTVVVPTTGPYTISADFNYPGGTASASSSTTVSQLITGTASPVPPLVPAGVPTPIGFTFTNPTIYPAAGPFSATVGVAPGTGSFGQTTNTCTSLAAGTSCTITGNLNTTATGNYTVTGNFNFAGPSVAVAPVTNAGRQVIVENHCFNDIWYSFNGAPVSPATNCVTTADCPTGSSCNPSADLGNGLCYWNNPSPTVGTLHLAPMVGSTPTTSTVIIPDLAPANPVVWQGNFAGRTGCSGLACDTSDCASGGGNNSCPPGIPFANPSSKPTMTLMRMAQDSYYLDLVNGITTRVSMGPTTETGSALQPYTCGTPGGVHNINGEPLCTWVFSPPNFPNSSNDYVFVKSLPAAVACSTNVDCVAFPGQVCGLSYNSTSSPAFKKTCGPQLGYWTANQACLVNNIDANPFFNCNMTLTGPLAGNFLYQLYACAPVTPGGNLDTCYASGATTGCCGCQNWDQAPDSLTTPAAGIFTQACNNFNADWSFTGNNLVHPTVSWIKAACPSARVYPFDTASSTFFCPAAPVTNNVTAYTISFCPV